MLTHADYQKFEQISRRKGEEVLKQLLKKNIIDRYEFVEDVYSHFDCIAYKEDRVCLIEIKYRYVNHNTYPDILLEKYKCKMIKETKADAYYYISIYQDDIAFVHRIDNVNESNNKVVNIKCPNFVENKPKEFYFKPCYLLAAKKQTFKLS